MDGDIFVVSALINTNLRPPASTVQNANGDFVFTFEPPLSGAEQAILNDIVMMAKFGIATSLTLAEFQAIKPDLATAKTYVGLASPTAAQTTAALKSTIRVIGALLRA